MALKIKRIIDGKTYNTETATLIATIDLAEPGEPYEQGEELYQTRFGAFFLAAYLEYYPDPEQSYERIEPYTPEQARAWLEKRQSYRTDLIEQLFGEMPEAGLGEVKYTLRMPESLRDRLAALAKANNQSLNAWMIRCLESCALPPTDQTKS